MITEPVTPPSLDASVLKDNVTAPTSIAVVPYRALLWCRLRGSNINLQ